ncbi:hypothetical protein ACFQ12_04935, partial [Methylobacterium trifolii]
EAPAHQHHPVAQQPGERRGGIGIDLLHRTLSSIPSSSIGAAADVMRCNRKSQLIARAKRRGQTKRMEGAMGIARPDRMFTAGAA